MSAKKIQNQVYAIADTVEAAKRRIDNLQRELDALRNASSTNQAAIIKKQYELDELKAKLVTALEHALLTLSIAPSTTRVVLDRVRRL